MEMTKTVIVRWAILGFMFCGLAVSSHAMEGKIIVDPTNPSWFVYNRDANKDGKLDPYFLSGVGDPEDFLYRGTRKADGTRNGDQTAIINKLKGTGSNGLYFQVIRSHGGDGESTHNPFVNSDPTQGLSSAILNQWETWFTEMDANGITIYLFLYDDEVKLWLGDTVGTAERNFIRGIVNKFKHHKHLIWVVAEEYRDSFSKARASAIAAEIRLVDPLTPIAIHQHSGISFDFQTDPNIDQFSIQYNRVTRETTGLTPTEMNLGIVSAFQEANGRYNLAMTESDPQFTTRTNTRKMSWAAAMGGAYVMVYKMFVTRDPTTEELQDLGRMRTFFEATRFNEMTPRNDLKYQGTEFVLAKPGSSYIAYAANATGSIGLKGLTAGSYRLIWFNPVTGSELIQNADVPGGDQSWAKPATFGSEVVLYAVRAGSSSGGSPTDPFKESNGLLVIEAENYHSKANTLHRDWYIFPPLFTPPSPDPDPPRDPAGVGGGRYVEILPDTRVTREDPQEEGKTIFYTGDNAPRMNYNIRVTSPGRYYFRGRALSSGSEDNSMHLGINNTWPISGTAVQWSLEPVCNFQRNVWLWSGNRRIDGVRCTDNTAWLDLTAGDHTLMIGMREDGFELDRFILTKDSNYFPSGIGPAESSRTSTTTTVPQPPGSLKVE